jgi:hypothetical protein
MRNKPSAKKEPPPELLLALGQAAQKAGRDNKDEHLVEVGNKALALGQKAMREGKRGLVTDGKGNFVIVEK